MNTENAKGCLRETTNELWLDGQVGDWAFDKDGSTIFIRIPDRSERGVMIAWTLRPIPDPQINDWQWDGNREAPTLTPSLHLVGVWHGWMTQGRLISC